MKISNPRLFAGNTPLATQNSGNLYNLVNSTSAITIDYTNEISGNLYNYIETVENSLSSYIKTINQSKPDNDGNIVFPLSSVSDYNDAGLSALYEQAKTISFTYDDSIETNRLVAYDNKYATLAELENLNVSALRSDLNVVSGNTDLLFSYIILSFMQLFYFLNILLLYYFLNKYVLDLKFYTFYKYPPTNIRYKKNLLIYQNLPFVFLVLDFVNTLFLPLN